MGVAPEANMSKPEGKFELKKFAEKKARYQAGMEKILSLGYNPRDYIEHFPAFTGDLTLARALVLYESYKKTLGVSGHIAEIGVYLGAGSLLFGKLVKLFEPSSTTLVHGFDWFQGMQNAGEAECVEEGSFHAEYSKLIELIKAQDMDGTVHIHNLDASRDLTRFFEETPHLQFKLVLVDAGLQKVVRAVLEHFWPRLTSDGIMLFDHFNHEIFPGETQAVKTYLPDAKFKTFPFGWMPTAYVVKP
jgi:hypothetical protein